jgi:phage head maturation protease
MEMYPMDRQQQVQNSSQERINDYLSRFKSNDTTPTSADIASENALDQYLLERAAEDLRAAKLRVDKVNRELGKY